ncbi:TctA family transporter [Sphingomonas jinjuensis]|uniref:TctA family transporter n=1 Tax=Sphingomonas jinjuensis TaxID=535907 RepID=A0A840FA56_9SPHN|nr:hypothetical protein [Sphingomonas jinjuensis]MBB4154529.1 TctA family transporter [Sphingomonas jinjuensis]
MDTTLPAPRRSIRTARIWLTATAIGSAKGAVPASAQSAAFTIVDNFRRFHAKSHGCRPATMDNSIGAVDAARAKSRLFIVNYISPLPLPSMNNI